MKKWTHCPHPRLELRCARCATTFLCGDAPHDEMGSYCPECGSIKIETAHDHEED